MKYEKLSDGNSALIAFFGGFACSGKILSRTRLPEDCDVVVFYDYRDFDTDFDFGAYRKIAVVAWSFGVGVADILAEKIGNTYMRIAVNGSPFPIDDTRGIPAEIFRKTLENFDGRAKLKFFRRICGGSAELAELEPLLADRTADELRDELAFLGKAFAENPTASKHWNAAFASCGDRIFPLKNLKCAFGGMLDVGEGEHLNVSDFGVALSLAAQRVSKTRAGFDKNSETYSENAFVQRDIAITLAEKLLDFDAHTAEVANILEVGCGTGFLTCELSPKFPAAQWHLNDISERMCERAAAKTAGARIVGGDVMSVNFAEKMDLIVSSSCLQWVSDLSALFEKFAKISSDGAVLAFSTFGAENFRQIKKLTGDGLRYYTRTEIRTLLAAAGFRVLYSAEDILDITFATPAEVLRHMKYTGVNGKFARFWTPRKFADFSSRYTAEFSDGSGVVLTYNPIYVIAEKSI